MSGLKENSITHSVGCLCPLTFTKLNKQKLILKMKVMSGPHMHHKDAEQKISAITSSAICGSISQRC